MPLPLPIPFLPGTVDMKMSLKVKILLLSILPFLALLYFTVHEITELVDARNNLSGIYNSILEAEKISNIVHELQKERGLSVGFLTSRGERQGNELALQKVIGDKKIEELSGLLKEAGLYSDITSLLNRLNTMRSKINLFIIEPIESYEYYTDTISVLLDEISEITKATKIPETKIELMAHLDLLYAKESLGQIRATLNAVFAAGTFDSFNIKKLAALKGAYDVRNKEYLKEAPEDVRKVYTEKFEGKLIHATMDMIDIAFVRYKEGNFEVDPDTWFEAATTSLNILKEVEDYSKEKIMQNTAGRLSGITTSLTVRIIVILVVVTAILVLSLSLMRNIFTGCNFLVSSITNIVETKNFNNRIPIYSNDEMGTISRAYNKLLETIGQLINEKEHLATTDPLTQAYNMFKFEDLFNTELQRAKRYKTELSLIMFDIDYFKRINDTYGHDVGNYVLIELSNITSKNIRSSDVLARWGGDEFVILVPEINIDGSKQLAEKLRNEVENFDFKDIGKVTCSFGVTEFKEGNDTEALYKRVDIALYRAKEGGRNRVCGN